MTFSHVEKARLDVSHSNKRLPSPPHGQLMIVFSRAWGATSKLLKHFFVEKTDRGGATDGQKFAKLTEMTSADFVV